MRLQLNKRTINQLYRNGQEKSADYVFLIIFFKSRLEVFLICSYILSKNKPCVFVKLFLLKSVWKAVVN